MRMRFKAWAEPYINENKHLLISSYEDLKKVNKTIHLEIGSGKGDFIVELALQNPDDLFIGVEISLMALAMSFKKVNEFKVKNVLFYLGDVNDFLLTCPKNVFSYLYLNFPDPWPKARHEKRRLTFKTKLSSYYDVIKREHELLFKTDNKDLYLYSLETFKESKFTLKKYGEHLLETEDQPQSSYERKFRQLKQPIYFILARRMDE